MSCSQPKCRKNVNLFSFVQHLLFLEALSQYKWFLFEIGQGKCEWGSCSKPTGTSRVGVSWGRRAGWCDRPWVPICARQGLPLAQMSHGQLCHAGKGEAGSPHLITSVLHPPGQHWLHPQLPAAMVWLPTPLHGCLHQHEVAALGMGCCGHQCQCVGWPFSLPAPSWCQQCLWWQVSSPAATETLKGCSLSWDCIFALPTVFCHWNVS